MILPTMNAREIRAEMQKDRLFIEDRMDGLTKKYRRQCVKSPKNTVRFLGKTTYVSPNRNRWEIMVMACNREFGAAMSLVVDGNYGKTYYQILTGYNDDHPSIFIYNPHFFDRVKQRAGLTPDEYIRACISLSVTVDHGKAYISDDVGVGLGREMEPHSDVYKVNTFVTYDMLYDNQTECTLNLSEETGLSSEEIILEMTRMLKMKHKRGAI